jgi:hypothetical protein
MTLRETAPDEKDPAISFEKRFGRTLRPAPFADKSSFHDLLRLSPDRC